MRLALATISLLALADCNSVEAVTSDDATQQSRFVPSGQPFTCTPIMVWDGDGPIWCAEGPKIRLAGIAAREMDGTCNPGHPCPPASAIAARDHLVTLLGGAVGKTSTGHIAVNGPRLSCLSDGSGKGSRTAAWCASRSSGDLNCKMVASGYALRWDRYWQDHRCSAYATCDTHSIRIKSIDLCATLQEAVINAEEALSGHLLVSEQHGDTLADPSSLDEIEPDPDVDEIARVLVRAEKPGKAVRVNITLDEGLLTAIDRVAKNRSGFLADAARAALYAELQGQQLRKAPIASSRAAKSVKRPSARDDRPLKTTADHRFEHA